MPKMFGERIEIVYRKHCIITMKIMFVIVYLLVLVWIKKAVCEGSCRFQYFFTYLSNITFLKTKKLKVFWIYASFGLKTSYRIFICTKKDSAWYLKTKNVSHNVLDILEEQNHFYRRCLNIFLNCFGGNGMTMSI